MQQWKLDPKDATLVALKMEEDIPKEGVWTASRSWKTGKWTHVEPQERNTALQTPTF